MEEEIILNRILEDANIQAHKIIEDAKEKASQIEREQQEQIWKEREAKIAYIGNNIKRNKESEIEKQELESRTAILTKKQEQIKIVKEQVKQKIKDLSVEELCNIYKNIISQFPNKNDLEIVVQEKNKKEIAKELEKLGVHISNETANFNYGIIIKDGNIEYNNCFEEIMKFNNEKIEKLIANILFS